MKDILMGIPSFNKDRVFDKMGQTYVKILDENQDTPNSIVNIAIDHLPFQSPNYA